MLSYAIKRQLSVPSISMKELKKYYFRVLAPIETKPARSPEDKPLSVLRVQDLESNISGEVVLGKVLLDVLNAAWPEPEDIVGRTILVNKRPGKTTGGAGGRGYFIYDVDEISVGEAVPPGP